MNKLIAWVALFALPAALVVAGESLPTTEDPPKPLAVSDEEQRLRELEAEIEKLRSGLRISLETQTRVAKDLRSLNSRLGTLEFEDFFDEEGRLRDELIDCVNDLIQVFRTHSHSTDSFGSFTLSPFAQVSDC